ncbi:MAG: helix-turn-helix domain-containing protein [Haloferacaceae archaeon]
MTSDGDDRGSAALLDDDAGERRQAALAALADPDCRRVAATLDDPLPAKEVAERCDLPRTTTYRKLELLSDGGLVDERVSVRPDGHHATTYVRDFAGVLVAVDGEGSFRVEVRETDEAASEDGADESPDERLARYWTEVSEEL